MQVHVIGLHPDGHVFPIRIVLPDLLEFHLQVPVDAWDEDLLPEPGHPHDMVLGLVDRMGGSVEAHGPPSYSTAEAAGYRSRPRPHRREPPAGLDISECSPDFFVIAGQKKFHRIAVPIEEDPI